MSIIFPLVGIRVRNLIWAIVGFAVCCSVPPQPRSTLRYQPIKHVVWIWAGALTSQSATVKARLAESASDPVLKVSTSEELDPAFYIQPSASSPGSTLASFELSSLQPETTYYYAVESGGEIDELRSGRFRTSADGPYSFHVALGTCARTGSNGRVWDTIREHEPLMIFHLGDFHYQSLGVDSIGAHRAAFDHVLSSPAQSLLFRTAPIAYVWDDHDFGPDNCDSTNPGRKAVGRVYRDYVPHYPLPAKRPEVSIYQAFTIGRVRFIITDLRSERSPHGIPVNQKTMMGSTQKAWFKEELLRGSRDFPLTVWLSSVPWIDLEKEDSDAWGGYSRERRELANFIAKHLKGKFAIIGGDAHMTAIDDGTNSGYSEESGKAFPVFHAGAFDQQGSLKGGPYSHGAFPGGGQFGLMFVDDQGDQITVRWSGRNWQDQEFISFTFSVPGIR